MSNLTTKQAVFASRIIGWIGEKDATLANELRGTLDRGEAPKGFVDQLLATNDRLKADARRSERKATAAGLQAANPNVVSFEGRIIGFEVDDYGTRKIVVEGSALLVDRVFVTFPAKLDASHGTNVRRLFEKGQEVVVRVAGKVTFFSGRSAKVTKAKGSALVELVTELPTDAETNRAARAWKALMTTEVVGEREIRCCSHDHAGTAYCYASVQVMSDIWENCGCNAKPGFQKTMVASTETVTAPRPAPSELVAWFEALTPAEQATADQKPNGYGMGTPYAVAHWALSALDRPESEHNCHARHWEQITYLGH